jgi:tRNA-dihydrouridine synthase B
MCEESGADFITVHGRTTMQGYSGKANYEEIAKVKASVNIPVIGNGDVIDVKSYKNMLATGVDGVMIGRGAQGNPWLFAKLLGKRPKIDKYEDIKKHIEILRENHDEKWIRLYIRKHFLWYLSGVKDAAKYRLEIATSDSVDKSLEILKELL